MLLELFGTFFIIGCISFGGGYAMIPVIQHEVLAHGWMTDAQFADTVAVAGMAPGPIATNSAIYIGYQTAGWPGSIISTVGMILPSVIVIVLVSIVFYKWYDHKWVKAVFYGLRPVIAGLILYAAIRLAMVHPSFNSLSINALIACLLILAAIVAIVRYNMHPLFVIILSALVNIAIYV
ncbi:chromate transporter [Paenibacillus eucommiae]|uniref:Chromate transporter n=1 Tax=Paenibacillus eucommiae TaxID=1355755 RepID=A0ABS4IW81_9BACL|nr:chromate transporter [Paenibacillus eucommiae]MBP1991768.1 chromate transporter [Paenibacillus eucommiae]